MKKQAKNLSSHLKILMFLVVVLIFFSQADSAIILSILSWIGSGELTVTRTSSTTLMSVVDIEGITFPFNFCLLLSIEATSSSSLISADMSVRQLPKSSRKEITFPTEKDYEDLQPSSTSRKGSSKSYISIMHLHSIYFEM